jgi:hypothetical protein
MFLSPLNQLLNFCEQGTGVDEFGKERMDKRRKDEETLRREAIVANE